MARTARRQEASVGDLRRSIVTLPQAAHILELDVGQVRKAIDRNVVKATYVVHGKRRVRALDGVDVLCLRMRDALKGPVRERLYVQLKHAPDREPLKKLLHVPSGGARGRSSKTTSVWVYDTASETLADIEALKDFSRLVDDAGKLRDSGVEAHRIAALVAGGMNVDEILEDYPNLGRPQVEAAVQYARTKPKQGRPYPNRTAKSVLRNGGGGGLAAAFAAARDGDKGEE